MDPDSMCLRVGLDVGLTWIQITCFSDVSQGWVRLWFNMDPDSMCLRVGIDVGLTWIQITCVSGLG
jgi:predicted NBD/HSP70 family sugar kinase